MISMFESEVEDIWERDSVFSVSLLLYMLGDDDDIISVLLLLFGGYSFWLNLRSSFLLVRNVWKLNGVRSSNKKFGWLGKLLFCVLYEFLIFFMEDVLFVFLFFESEDFLFVLVF